jgi:hypothetical protein
VRPIGRAPAQFTGNTPFRSQIRRQTNNLQTIGLRKLGCIPRTSLSGWQPTEKNYDVHKHVDPKGKRQKW